MTETTTDWEADVGKLDEMKNKAKEMVSGNRDRIEDGLEKAGEMVNQRTGGKHADKIDQGLEKAKQGLDRAEGSTGTGSAEPADPMEGQAPKTPPPSGPPMG